MVLDDVQFRVNKSWIQAFVPVNFQGRKRGGSQRITNHQNDDMGEPGMEKC